MRLRTAGILATIVAGTAVIPASASGPGLASPAQTVIVRERPGDEAAAERALTQLGGRVTARIAIIDAVVAELPTSAVAGLAHNPSVLSVTGNAAVHLLDDNNQEDTTGSLVTMAEVAKTTGASNYWRRGLDGTGVDVALIDSGVTPVAGLSGAGLVNAPDLSFDSQVPVLRHLDAYGHGTFMASLIIGNDGRTGSRKGNRNGYRGMAPGARLISLKVADAHGYTDVSQMLAAIDWVVQHRNSDGLHIKVLNLSFGTHSGQSYDLDPLAYAAEVAWRNGIVVIASAGNGGSASASLTDPAYDPYLIAAGAEDTSTAAHGVATFSSRGDGTRNPDLLAPGSHIQGLRVPGSFIDTTYGATGRVGERFFRGSGTSEAAAILSGAAALIVQQHPDATPDQVKALLVNNAAGLNGAEARAAGAGELDLRHTQNADLPQAVQQWPASSGTGSIELARGGAHIAVRGAQLSGEVDIFGRPLNTTALAAAESAGTSWDGGTWNGSQWTGVTWSGVTWSGVTWSDRTWSGLTWSCPTWSGVTWSDSVWNGITWSGMTWSGMTWSGMTWSGMTWSGMTWSGMTWSGLTWSSDLWI